MGTSPTYQKQAGNGCREQTDVLYGMGARHEHHVLLYDWALYVLFHEELEAEETMKPSREGLVVTAVAMIIYRRPSTRA
jgi:hypothetical protein